MASATAFRSEMGYARLIFRMIAMLVVTGLAFLFVVVLFYLRLTFLKQQVLQLYYFLMARVWGIRVRCKGTLPKQSPALVVSNHCSYTDIPVLGSLIPVHFTPKAEIRSWPVIGYLCLISDCIFINRNPRKTAENMVQLKQAVERSWMISLFPEGTTNNGMEVLPFRSSYFKLVEQGLPIQPVTVRYLRRDGKPLSASAQRKISWVGDDEFGPHILEFLKQPGILAEVIFHEVIESAEMPDRKALALQSHKVVASAL